jgi:hypothetical protein
MDAHKPAYESDGSIILILAKVKAKLWFYANTMYLMTAQGNNYSKINLKRAETSPLQ